MSKSIMRHEFAPTGDRVPASLVPRVIPRDVIALRRDLHRFAEPAWTEFRTAALVVEVLREAGFDVASGRRVLGDGRAGVPAAADLEAAARRAVEQGADPELVRAFAGGYTGVV